jgi:hypothetical protein
MNISNVHRQFGPVQGLHGSPHGLDIASTDGRWLLAVAVAGSSMAFLDGTVVNVALPDIGRVLHRFRSVRGRAHHRLPDRGAARAGSGSGAPDARKPGADRDLHAPSRTGPRDRDLVGAERCRECRRSVGRRLPGRGDLMASDLSAQPADRAGRGLGDGSARPRDAGLHRGRVRPCIACAGGRAPVGREGAQNRGRRCGGWRIAEMRTCTLQGTARERRAITGGLGRPALTRPVALRSGS